MSGASPNKVTLREMTAADVDPAVALVLAGGWADFRLELAFAVASPAGVALVAEEGGEPIGIGVGTRNGTVGWVGPIFTTPERRGRGVGRALTEAVARELEAASCDALLLAATELGRPLYERLGFVADGHYHVLSGPAAALPNDSGSVRVAGPADRAAVRALDRWASGEDRTLLLDAFGAPTWVASDGLGDPVRGYALATPWGSGPVIATDPNDALALLRRSATVGGDGRVRAILPEENAAGRATLAGLGFEEARSLPRMRRGRGIEWHPAAIWRLFSLGMG